MIKYKKTLLSWHRSLEYVNTCVLFRPTSNVDFTMLDFGFLWLREWMLLIVMVCVILCLTEEREVAQGKEGES